MKTLVLNKYLTPKMRLSLGAIFFVALAMGFAVGLSGCFSTTETKTQAVTEKVSTAPVVEAYVEYAGPSEKWAGPGSMILHVVAKGEMKDAEIRVTPKVESEGRKIASTQAMTAELARHRLAELAEAAVNMDQKTEGCLSPVRIKFIRQDGAAFEKMGCRSQQGWPGVASQVTADLIGFAQ